MLPTYLTDTQTTKDYLATTRFFSTQFMTVQLLQLQCLSTPIEGI